MKYKELMLIDIVPGLLDGFDRYEEINRAWRYENGVLQLKEIHYTENWDETELQEVIQGLEKTLRDSGAVFAAYDKEFLVGFAALEHKFFGSKLQYLQLSMLHITRSHRGKGIGKELFGLCAERARRFGAAKLYISASSCENGQSFYKRMGCLSSEEINQELHQLEPFDCQLEYIL